jgi:hypothetical protein
MSCSLLRNYIQGFKNRLGYEPSFENCFIFLQSSGMNEIEVSNCMNDFAEAIKSVRNLKRAFSNMSYDDGGNISMGVL